MGQLVELPLGSARVGDFAEQAEQMIERWQGNLLAVGLPCIDSEITPRRNRAFSLAVRFMEGVAFQTHLPSRQYQALNSPDRTA
jgi:hypothetical protein